MPLALAMARGYDVGRGRALLWKLVAHLGRYTHQQLPVIRSMSIRDAHALMDATDTLLGEERRSGAVFLG